MYRIKSPFWAADNDELECELTSPPLSSVEIPGKRIGYEAAQLLDRIMLGKSATEEPLLLPPVRVVTRQSTDALVVEDPVVRAAMIYIRLHFSENIGGRQRCDGDRGGTGANWSEKSVCS